MISRRVSAISLVQPIFHFGGKGFQAFQHQTHLLIHLCFFVEVPVPTPAEQETVIQMASAGEPAPRTPERRRKQAATLVRADPSERVNAASKDENETPSRQVSAPDAVSPTKPQRP
jgi:hypothetical protein